MLRRRGLWGLALVDVGVALWALVLGWRFLATAGFEENVGLGFIGLILWALAAWLGGTALWAMSLARSATAGRWSVTLCLVLGVLPVAFMAYAWG